VAVNVLKWYLDSTDNNKWFKKKYHCDLKTIWIYSIIDDRFSHSTVNIRIIESNESNYGALKFKEFAIVRKKKAGKKSRGYLIYSRVDSIRFDFIIYVFVRRVCVCDYYSDNNSYHHGYWCYVNQENQRTGDLAEPLQQNVTFCDAERFVAFGNLNICTYAESYTDTWRLHAPVHPCIRT